MGIWADRVLPHVIDGACGMATIQPFREAACAGLRGRVLEIGFGSGLNCPLYPAEVTAVEAIEPSETAWRMSQRRRDAAASAITRGGLDGQRLPYDDATFDAALSTFTLCTIPDVAGALAEVRRVLRPGGRLHFAEHGQAPDESVARWQHRLDPVQGFVFGGCHLSRDITALLTDAGFEVSLERAEYLPGPRISRPWGFGYAGSAARSA